MWSGQRRAARHSAALRVRLSSAALPRVGTRVHGYRVVRHRSLADLQLECVELAHERSGAQHLHVAADDRNNLFGVTFKTVPRDSSGVAHILEHVTLCGSQRYPVRDPFFAMLRRSLNTFMNAWTAADHTSYPFATLNAADYRNLLAIYLDCTFNPQLHALDFAQEGHRLSFDNLDAPVRDELRFHGVVFNEMKGAMSDPHAVVAEALDGALFPTTTYGHNSGGAPLDIPTLTHEQLKAFHARHYHPSNARFVTYGDMPLEQHLEQINETIGKFERIDPDTDIPNEQRLREPRRVRVTCPPAPGAAADEHDAKVLVSWLCERPSDPFDSFAMNLLSSLLLNGQNAPLYQALIESGLATSYSIAGYDDHYHREPPFTVGLTGVANDNADKVVQTVLETLSAVERDGIPRERVDAAVHQIEVALRHKSTMFGMAVFRSVISPWLHGDDPIEPLRVRAHVERLNKELDADPQFFQHLLRRAVLDNAHRVEVVATPDAGYDAQQVEREEALLERERDALTPERTAQIVEQARALEQRQATEDDLTCLPTLTRDDIAQEEEPPVLERRGVLQRTAQPTGGLAYIKVAFGEWGGNLAALPSDLAPYGPLCTQMFSRLGTSSMTHRELAQAIELHCGSFGASIGSVLAPHSVDLARTTMSARVSALDRNVPRALELLGDVLTDTNWAQPEQLRTHIAGVVSQARDNIAQSGHMYARRLAAASLGEHWLVGERWGGLSQIAHMQSLLAQPREQFDAELPQLLERAAQQLLGADRAMRVSLVAPDGDELEHANRVLDSALLPRLGEHAIGHFEADASGAAPNNFATDLSGASPLFVALPLPVNYAALCVRSVAYTHGDYAPLRLLAPLMRVRLHADIREKGGAYGGGAFAQAGLFGMYSYRDPHVERTIEAFYSALEWAERGEFSDNDLHEALLSVMADVDAPVAPSGRGSSAFASGVTAEQRRVFRQRVLACTRDDVLRACRAHVSAPMREKRASIAVLGDKQRAAALKPVADLGEWRVSEKVSL